MTSLKRSGSRTEGHRLIEGVLNLIGLCRGNREEQVLVSLVFELHSDPVSDFNLLF